MATKDYGQTRSGEPVTEELLEKLSAKAKKGVDVEEILRRRGGRPPRGSSAASVESVRLDPELSKALRERAEQEGRTNSDLIRDALSRYSTSRRASTHIDVQMSGTRVLKWRCCW